MADEQVRWANVDRHTQRFSAGASNHSKLSTKYIRFGPLGERLTKAAEPFIDAWERYRPLLPTLLEPKH